VWQISHRQSEESGPKTEIHRMSLSELFLRAYMAELESLFDDFNSLVQGINDISMGYHDSLRSPLISDYLTLVTGN